jgi:hypothetical protein
MKPSWRALQIASGLIAFFVILAITGGAVKAALGTLSIVVAYFVEFYVFRTAVRLFTFQAVKPRVLVVSALTVIAGALLVYLHSANILGTAIACLFLMDAGLQRFRYTPIE